MITPYLDQHKHDLEKLISAVALLRIEDVMRMAASIFASSPIAIPILSQRSPAPGDHIAAVRDGDCYQPG